MKDHLIEKLERKEAKMAVLGLGYVGLPLAVVFAEAGFDVIGMPAKLTHSIKAKDIFPMYQQKL